MSEPTSQATSSRRRIRIAGPGATLSGSDPSDPVIFLEWRDWIRATDESPDIEADFLELDAERRRIEQLALDWASATAPAAVRALGNEGTRAQRATLVTRRLLQHGPCYSAARAYVAAERLLANVPRGATVDLTGVDPLTSAFLLDAGRRRGVTVSGAAAAERLGLLPGVEAPLLRAVASAARHLLRAPARGRAARAARAVGTDPGRRIAFVSQAPRDEAIAGPSVRLLAQRGAGVIKVDLSRDGRMLDSGFPADAVVDGRLWSHAYPLDIVARYLARRARAVAETTAALPTEAKPAAASLAPLAVAFAGVTAPALMRSTGTLLDDLAPDRVVLLGETNRVVEPLAHEAKTRGIPVTCVQHGVIHDIPQWAEMPFSTFAVCGGAYAEVLASLGTPPEHIVVTGDPRLDRAVAKEPRPLAEVITSLGEISPNARIVLFAANYTSHRLSGSSMERAFSALVEGMSGLENVVLVVKLHPQGAGRELPYERVASRRPDVSIHVAPRDSNLVDLIATADAVAVHVSSVGFEAAAMRTPLLVVNPDEGRQEVPFTREGIGHEARDASEVRDVLGRLLSGDLGIADDETMARFNLRYNHLLDGRATERLADAVEASRW